MAATTTKTLEATLAPPTAHKERKLCDLLDTYREGLHEAFDAGCDTMSATSDVVTRTIYRIRRKQPCATTFHNSTTPTTLRS